jgi:hypothetical protein
MLDGEVLINGESCYRGINPVIAEYGFRLWRLDETHPSQIREYGPHFNLSLPTPSLFQQISREALIASVKYTFSGPYLGTTTDNSGIASLHEGPKMRYVDFIEVEVIFRDKVLFLTVSGAAAHVHPDPSQSIDPKHCLEPISFLIQCPIPTALIPSVFPGRPGWFLQRRLECESIQDYLEAIKYGPPKDIT